MFLSMEVGGVVDIVVWPGRAGMVRSRQARRGLGLLVGLVVLASTLSGCRPIVRLSIGSARNFLGTNALTGFGSQPENFWLSIGGYCSRREFGELVTAYADNNANSTTAPYFSCQPGAEGGPSYVRRSATYNASGYRYRVDTAHATGPVTIQIYDPPVCGNPMETMRAPASQQTSFRLYTQPSPSSPAVDVAQRTFTTADCALAQTWWTLAEVDPAAGPYVIQVTAPPPATAAPTTEELNNQFALRAAVGTWGPCAADPNLAGAGVPFDEHCPSITAIGALGAYESLPAGGSTTMPVGAIAAANAGRRLHVELFDAAEGGHGIELLDPNGDPVTVQAEIACQDGTYLSATGAASCSTGELPPTESPTGSGLTYGPWTTTRFDNCGPLSECGGSYTLGPWAQQPWGLAHLTQRTQYSDRTIRLTTTVPADYEARYGGRTQWAVRLINPSSGFSDRLTMTATVR